MNSGVVPLLLEKNQLAFATNCTVRGTFVTHRSPFRQIALSFPDDTTKANFQTKLWQGAGYYHPDSGSDRLIAQIAGNLFEVTPSNTTATATVTDKTINNDPNSATLPQVWMWQSEKWMIVQNGSAAPIFYDGTSAVRSIYQGQVAGTTSADITISSNAAVDVFLQSQYTGSDGAYVYLAYMQYPFLVNSHTVIPPYKINVTPQTYSTTFPPTSPTTVLFPAGTIVYYKAAKVQLPPGRCGCYGLGRNWMALADGKQFLASDIVGSSSGTVANNFRDAVLSVTENTYLAGGGNFTVPGNTGDIRAMAFTATLDSSLGQGPLQVFTPLNVFSCNAPVDRTTWASITNPILTQSLIAGGSLSQNSTVLANGDALFRAIDGIRSLILGRREFTTWGNTSVSDEMQRVIQYDNQSLLQYASAVVFDNRLLMTANPVSTTQGVVHKGLYVMNFDPVSSLRGKAPSVYDGLWTGLNVLQLVTGLFNGIQRTFAFCLNTGINQIELWEVQLDTAAYYDNGSSPITWVFESPILDFNEKDNPAKTYKRLMDGELQVDDIKGQVDFTVEYRPDQSPCWATWSSWSECAATVDNNGNALQPQYRSRMGLGEPSAGVCDPSTGKTFRDGYWFQVRITVRGHCRFLGARFKAVTIPEDKFAQPSCKTCTP